MKLLAVLLASIATIAFGIQKPAAQLAIEKQMAKLSQAMRAKDIAAVKAIYAPSLKVTNTEGRSATYKEVIEQLKGTFKQVKSIKLACEITSFTPIDKGARLTCINKIEAILVAPDGKEGKLLNVSTTEETWTLLKGAYRVTGSRQLTNKATFNGIPVVGG